MGDEASQKGWWGQRDRRGGTVLCSYMYLSFGRGPESVERKRYKQERSGFLSLPPKLDVSITGLLQVTWSEQADGSLPSASK